MKWLPVKRQPERITVTSIVYIPELSGFWAESLDVLKLCFESLHANTRPDFDLMVLDNGSCEEVRTYLQERHRAGDIQFLILSEYNLRKLGGLNVLLGAAPGEIIAYADSDVYFLPGWLEASVEVLETFPEAGQVTALPIAGDLSQHCVSTLEGAEADAAISLNKGHLIPDQYVTAHRISLGETPKKYSRRLKDRRDVLLSKNSVEAYASAADFQFITRKKIVQPFLPLQVTRPGEYYDSVYSPSLEARLDEAGFWRLSTRDYYVHHLGNGLNSLSSALGWLPISIPDASTGNGWQETKPAQSNHSFVKRLRSSPKIRRVVKKVVAAGYRFLYEA